MTKIITLVLITISISQSNITCMDHYTRAMRDGSQRMPKEHNNYYVSTYKKHPKKRTNHAETVERNKERYSKYKALEIIHN